MSKSATIPKEKGRARNRVSTFMPGRHEAGMEMMRSHHENPKGMQNTGREYSGQPLSIPRKNRNQHNDK